MLSIAELRARSALAFESSASSAIFSTSSALFIFFSFKQTIKKTAKKGLQPQPKNQNRMSKITNRICNAINKGLVCYIPLLKTRGKL
jgi:hypothetical protein